MNHEELRIETQLQLQRGADMVSAGSDVIRAASDNLALLRCDSTEPAPSESIAPIPSVTATRELLADIIGPKVTWANNIGDIELIGSQFDATVEPQSEKPTSQVQAGFNLLPSRGYLIRSGFRLPEDFDFGGELESGKLGFGITGGTRPSGCRRSDEGCSVRLGWRNKKPILYYYGEDHKGVCGLDYPAKHDLIPGTDYTAELEVMTNTAGKSDGFMSLTLNGERVIGVKGLHMMNGAGSLFQMWFNFFHGGGDQRWRPEKNQTARFWFESVRAL